MSADNELDPSRVELGKFYPQPPAAVWRTLTDPTGIEHWLLPSVGFEGPHPGTPFLFTLPTNPPSAVACEVLSATPGESMVWSWMDPRGPQPVRWTVTWILQPQGHGTRLLLTTTGFDITDKFQRIQRNNIERGWRQVLSKLATVLDGR
ncbi:SRPBCC domain-containing protein [Nocardia sp. 2]|uniref:SRPBCC domain-containing protein n=1 Tax=Nocardia acididurans TaxID=2802282 RepID=A0ABS1M077_9NOCA|nr:SRPBCC domain-containing protein [Nocardia acididurans]MBL1074067.1 SRPBCC domain-containing protein [Nocardia acididurans]